MPLIARSLHWRMHALRINVTTVFANYKEDMFKVNANEKEKLNAKTIAM